MTRFRISLSSGAAAVSLVLAAPLFSAPAEAQVWVSNVNGTDDSGCTFPATPCRTLQYVASNYPANTDVKCLDAVNEYAGLYITKPITIDCTGAPGLIYSSVQVTAVYVDISEASYPDGVVTLRGLTIMAHPGATGFIQPGVDGIGVFGGGAAVHIENSTIEGFSEQGIDFRPTSSVDLFVRDTIIRNNAGGGVVIAPAAAAAVRGSLSNVRLDRNGFGFSMTKTSGGVAVMTVDDTNVEKNVIGLRASGASSLMVLTGSTIVHNSTGLQTLSGGTISSSGNNTIRFNTVDGAPTITVPLK